jgi:dephospho-CoA kinase
LIVGIFGEAGSGKDTVASFFETAGYVHVSSSDLLRDEIARRGQITSRALQTEVANELRLTHGVGYWMDQSVATAPAATQKLVISGLYSPGEGLYLRERFRGILTGVVAGDDSADALRLQRIQQRADGARDQLDSTELEAAQRRENGGTAPHETNLGALLQLADYVIYNTAGLSELQDRTTEVAAAIEEAHRG